MIEEKLLSEFEVSRELNTGIAVTRFLLNRFEDFLLTDRSSGRAQYPSTSVATLISIKQALDKGQAPDQIEEVIKSTISKEKSFPVSDDDNSNNTQNNNDSEKSWLKALLTDLSEQQKRLAIAQEKRVQAEERKAAAIEKRANAEEQKAIAMGNIAATLQELTSLRNSATDPQISQIACKTAQIFPIEEDMDLEIVQEKPFSDTLGSSTELAPPQDLSLLLDEAFPQTPLPGKDSFDMPQETSNKHIESEDEQNYLSDLDDLSGLIDTFEEESSEPNPPLSSPESIVPSPTDIDNLYSLLDEPNEKAVPVKPEEKADRAMEEMDDLSALIEDAPQDIKQDDLSLLLEKEDESTADSNKPNTSTLPPSTLPIDDLSKLLTPSEAIPMDDLSKLLDSTESLKPLITPQEDLEAYKAAIIDIIIKQKTAGLSAEETAIRMNQDEVKTLSGKPEWSIKAVEQIYKFIDAANQ